MRREAVVALQRHKLSESEAELLDVAVADTDRERVEDFLYFHLDCARRARLRMDGMADWSHAYATAHRQREVAMRAAAAHYRMLLGDGGGIPGLLAEMALTEGLTT